MQSAGVKTIHKEGYMFKIGRKMRRMIKRHFRLNQNLLYWYNNDDPEAPLLGVLFVEGSYISPSSEDAFTSKGYYGINIHTRFARARLFSQRLLCTPGDVATCVLSQHSARRAEPRVFHEIRRGERRVA
jgi:hypothetical protein